MYLYLVRTACGDTDMSYGLRVQTRLRLRQLGIPNAPAHIAALQRPSAPVSAGCHISSIPVKRLSDKIATSDSAPNPDGVFLAGFWEHRSCPDFHIISALFPGAPDGIILCRRAILLLCGPKWRPASEYVLKRRLPRAPNTRQRKRWVLGQLAFMLHMLRSTSLFWSKSSQHGRAPEIRKKDHADTAWLTSCLQPSKPCGKCIRIRSLTDPHDDLPADMQMFAQLVINGNIFLQTVPVESEASQSSWKLHFGCNIPQYTLGFLVAILRHSRTAGTRLLGSAEIGRGEVLELVEANHSFKIMLNRVNPDGPLLELSAGFTASEGSALPLSGLYVNNIGENRITSVNNHGITADLLSMKNESPVDPLQLWVMHERLLLLSQSNETRAGCLNMLGDICRQWYTNTGTVDGLNQAVWVYTDAVRDDLMSAMFLSDLGIALHQRFEQLGSVVDINQGKEIWKAAVGMTLEGDPARPSQLNNLASSLSCQFEWLGDLTDLNESVSRYEAAVSLTPEGHPDMPSLLNNLGNSLFTRFKRLGDLNDLNESVSKQKAALSLTPEGHPGMPSCLNNLGSSLLKRFEWLGDLTDLNESVFTFKAAIRLAPEGHPAMPSWLNNLGDSLLWHFELFGDLTDLNESVSRYEAAVSLTPEGHPDMPSLLNNLGNSLLTRFKRLGDLNDLNESVSKQKAVLSLTPEGHPGMPSCLNNLGSSLLKRFERLGNLTDLDESVFTFKAAVRLAPEGHPAMPSWLNNLGDSLLWHFERLGDLTDLNESVAKQKAAVSLTPEGHPDMPLLLNNLGRSLLTRFKRLGDLNDLNESVSKREAALSLTPEGHPAMPPCLNNAGRSLLTRFKRLGDLHDLNESVSKQKAAVSLTPEGHPSKASHLNDLGSALLSQFDQVGDLTDLNESVSRHEAAISLTPEDHPAMPSRLNNLGNSLLRRFERLGDLTDLNESVSTFRVAVSLAPEGHPDMPSWLHNFGDSLHHRFNRSKDPHDCEEMLLQYSRAASSPTGSVQTRLEASAKWAHYAQIQQYPSVLRAYATAIDLVPKVAWLGLSISDRHHQLLRAGELVRDAASAAVEAQEYSKAVEWLEQGRSVIWGQFLTLCTPVDKLHRVHPKLAAELVSLSNLLETSGTQSHIEAAGFGPSQSLQATARQYHDHAVQRDNLLQQIRGLAGFEHFLLPKPISELSPAAKIGPVVLLNTSSYRSDALILIPGVGDKVMHVPLPDFTLDQAQHLTEALGSLVRGAARSDRLDACREDELPPDEEFSRILSALWMKIVKPVLDGLTFTDPGHIWWCPTGPLAFLPIHAAGHYGPEAVFGSKLSDFLISSYTPSLSALIEGFRVKQESQDGLQLLAVAQPSAVGQNPIPGTIKEIASIQHLAHRVIPVLHLEGDMATVESVQKGMRESRWAHFACHGLQDIFTPTNSALLLAGSSKLTLSDVIQLQLPHADLAFLSACQTATGSKNLQDESVHLTAGMLLAGYRGVIGTMWSIMDADGPQVAGDVYAHLFKTSPPDSMRAAEALHLAVQKLRDSDGAGGTKSFSRWVPFIHVGV
ncbi:CHAT domain-containing protein [Mycena latifolia]|nr:CHAT domain-containing protein [Mycena latifolia]